MFYSIKVIKSTLIGQLHITYIPMGEFGQKPARDQSITHQLSMRLYLSNRSFRDSIS